MIKALLIVMGLSGGVDYTTEMPTMKSGLDGDIIFTCPTSKGAYVEN